MVTAEQLIEIILCIFIPPLAVYFHGRQCDVHLLINILLCIFCVWFGGIVHAFWYCFFK